MATPFSSSLIYATYLFVAFSFGLFFLFQMHFLQPINRHFVQSFILNQNFPFAVAFSAITANIVLVLQGFHQSLNCSD